jgi:hypothetical protein
MIVRRAARLWCDRARRVPRRERSPIPEPKRKLPAFSPRCKGRDGLRRDHRRRRGPRKVRYSKRGEPGDIHRRRLEYLRPGRRLSTEAGSGPGIVRESHTPGISREYGQMTIRAEFVPGREPPDTRTRPSRRSSWFHTLHPAPNSASTRLQSWLLSSECRPHSVLACPAQRPARSSSPEATARVHGQHPIEA